MVRMAGTRRQRLVVIATLVVASLLLFHSSSSDTLSFLAHTSHIQFQKSSFDWSNVAHHHPVTSITPLPKGPPKTLPPVQHKFSRAQKKKNAITESRREAVKAAFVRSWSAYKEHAWLHDELKPVSGGFKDPFGGWAATMVDSLDTMWIMGLDDEFREAAAAAVSIDFNRTDAGAVNVFETTIRHLGGLLSAYDLSGERALLQKAQELGEMLYHAFDTPNRFPGFWLNFEEKKMDRLLAGTHDPSASPASLCMEFTRLAQLTGDDKFFDATDRIRAFLDRTQETSQLPGMWPAMINFRDETLSGDNSFSLGALADSLYEYLPKMFVLLAGRSATAASYEKMYRRAMDVVVEHVLFRPMLPNGTDILFAGTTYVHGDGVHLVPEGQHLHCFLGGMFALGGRIFGMADHVNIGERLARGCAWVYAAFPTGLMPEYFELIPCEDGPRLNSCRWDEERWKKEGDPRLARGFRHARETKYMLRPEAIESLFVLYRATGQEELRDMAWTMFQSIMKATETSLAYSAIKDVTVVGETEKEDSMESFWLSETLKYFYLIFSPPDLIDLDEYVLNTEAHPFKRS